MSTSPTLFNEQGALVMIRKIVDGAFLCLERALAVALVVAVLLNFANVVTRYLFSFTMSFADEIELFILVFVTFLGAVVVSWRRVHLRMDVFVSALPATARRIVQGLEAVVTLGLMSYFAYQSFDYTQKMFLLGRRSDIAGLPMWVPNGSLAAGFGLIAVVSFFHLVVAFTRPAKDEGLVEPEFGQ